MRVVEGGSEFVKAIHDDGGRSGTDELLERRAQELRPAAGQEVSRCAPRCPVHLPTVDASRTWSRTCLGRASHRPSRASLCGPAWVPMPAAPCRAERCGGSGALFIWLEEGLDLDEAGWLASGPRVSLARVQELLLGPSGAGCSFARRSRVYRWLRLTNSPGARCGLPLTGISCGCSLCRFPGI